MISSRGFAIGPASFLATICLAATLTAAPSNAVTTEKLIFSGALQDLSPATVDPFDGARARVVMAPISIGTRFYVTLRGIDQAAIGTEYGAHLHSGPCVAGDPAAALGHYNISTTIPPVVSPSTEVWLDFVVGDRGVAHSSARVPFVPVAGARSVVIHALPTDDLGIAGPRLACLPVVW